MNQMDHNNEYEVMDSGSMYRQPRYPLANASGSELQNMGYKEWMEMCPDVKREILGQIGIRPYQIDEWEAVGKTLTIVTGTIAAIAGVASASFPPLIVVAGVFAIISLLLDVLWPDSDPASADSQSTWYEFMDAAEVMVGKKISEVVKSRADVQLRIVQSRIQDYQQAACNFQKYPNDARYQELIRDAFDDAEDALKDAIKLFSEPRYELLLLFNYMQAANLHLLLLKDVVRFGESWGFPQQRVDQYYTNTGVGNPGMVQLIVQYTNYSMNQYERGIRDKEEETKGSFHYQEEYFTYRTNMTMLVLDLVALWPTYDPYRYPLATEVQLTRKVFSACIGVPAGNFDKWPIEMGMTWDSAPTLFRWLQLFTVVGYRNADVAQHFAGVNSIYRTTNSPYDITVGTGNSPRPEDRIEWRSYGGRYNYVLGNRISSGRLNYMRFFDYTGGSFYAGYSGSPLSYDTYFGTPCKDVPLEANDPDVCQPNQWQENPTGVCFSSQYGTNNLNAVIPDGYSYINPGKPFATSFAFAWQSNTCDPSNYLRRDKIAQIPAVKGNRLGPNDSYVIRGPGFTGGDLVELRPGLVTGAGGVLEVHLYKPVGVNYDMRFRYTTATFTQLQVVVLDSNLNPIRTLPTFSMSQTTNQESNLLRPESFLYTYTERLTLNQLESITLRITNIGTGKVVLDKIEFLPVGTGVEVYEAENSLNKVRKTVGALFTNDAKNALELNITEYQVDQAARLVECMSDEMYPKEKMCLLDQVKCAKRLSQARNLLNAGDFESSESFGENAWKTSSQVVLASDNPLFKGRYLHMSGANYSPFHDQVFPTYAYQKIEEAKLKPYTRYMVRGFIGNSKDLEVFAVRYDKEVHKNMNVPNDSILTNPCTGEYPLKQGSYPVMINQVIPQNMSCGPCEDGSQMMMQQTSMVCADPHEWECHIDTGELDINQNLGIWVGFKIGTTDGLATLDNIEVIEEGPLTGEALTRMKKREYKWKQKWNEKYMKIEKAVQVAQRAIQGLFTHADQSQLQASVTLQHIIDAEKWVQNIPYVYHPFLVGALPTVPGEAYDIFQQLSGAVAKARVLYEQRNVLRNGDFNAGLSNWQGTEGTQVQQIGNTSVLVISDWSTNVSQQVCVHPEHGYVLRVTAKKEGSGEGYVKISDGTEENTETLKFIAGESATSLVPPMTPSRESYYEQDMTNYPAEQSGSQTYANGNQMNYQSESFGINPYGDEDMMNDPASYAGTDCGCGCSKKASMSYPPNNYEMNAYAGNTSGANPTGSSCGCGCHRKVYTSEDNMTTYASESLSGYITKTVEIFPETNLVCIEIGETAGTFLVESIELIRMGCE
ncbi:insecticidal delta-endotoxin Cry8Ea1 family protein [Bacillus cereus group sp. IBL03679]|uniref:insecticidal delta-endotoxin Cry8Ea1 family protein n=1 Tax=Bacillus cereus group sp. IBL03679 TaxID=3240095 RepID=UPI003D2F75A7